MKKMCLVLSLIFLSISLLGCQNSEVKNDNSKNNIESLQKITIYPLKNSTESIDIVDTETITLIKEVVDHAEKQPGIVNMADPEFRIEIGEETYFLWIDEESGTIMNTNDAHTVYSLSENAISVVNGLMN